MRTRLRFLGIAGPTTWTPPSTTVDAGAVADRTASRRTRPLTVRDPARALQTSSAMKSSAATRPPDQQVVAGGDAVVLMPTGGGKS